MKKLFVVLLTVCFAFSITACANSVDPVVDDAVEDYVPSIDRYEVEAIIVQYENSGQYFLSDTEITEFAQLYNQHESYRASEEELGEEEYVVVVTYTNGDYLLIKKYNHAEYDFASIDYVDYDSWRKSTAKYLIKNASLSTFMDNLIQKIFITN